MERFSDREGVVLGHSSQRSLGSSNASASSRGNSDVDFADVFGGPPRRSPSHEMRCSVSESTVSRASSSQNSWTGLMEKPVFGEDVSNRRRHTSHDFFDDIFNGGDCSSSPRKNERESIFSVPGSRALSPNQPLPPKAETLSSSLPAQLSLPANLVKGTELPTYSLGTLNYQRNKDGASNGINHYSYSPLSRSSSQKDRVEELRRNHVEATFRKSSSSKNICPNSLELSNLTTLDVTEEVGNSKMDSGNPDTSTNGSQFHFSIYKWASKGVPIAMPLRGRSSSRLKEAGKIVRCSSLKQKASEGMERGLPTETPNDFDFLCLTNIMSTNNTSSRIQLDKENVTLFDGITPGRQERTQIFEEEVLPITESEILSTHQNIDEDIPGNSNAYDAAEKRRSQSLFEMDLPIEPEQDTSVFKKEAPKTKLNTLGSLLCDDNDGQGNDKMAAKNSVKERKTKTTKYVSALFPSTKNVKKQNHGKPVPDTAEVGKDSLLDAGTTLEGSPGTKKIKGKVKEFVKFFNQDSLSKSKPDVNSQGCSSRWKDKDTSTKEHKLIATTKAAEENMHVANVSQKKTPEAVTKMAESSMQTEKQDYHVQPKIYTPGGTSTGKISSTASTATSISGGLAAIGGDADELFSGNFLRKELPQDENILVQTGNNHEEIQVIDSKIRQWSSEKDGNIRSLLSTLQYVLWPGSGWRPVPLVDIIEGNAVKRSYQKALLCLHPDKLQQKGASFQQKYIAEKVFDILQEAWTHFNSLGSFD